MDQLVGIPRLVPAPKNYPAADEFYRAAFEA